MDSESVNTRDTFIHLQPEAHTGSLIIFLSFPFLQQALIQDIDGLPVPSVTIQVIFPAVLINSSFFSSPFFVLFLYIFLYHMSCCLVSLLSPYYNLSSSLQVKVKASSVVQASKLTVSIQPPLAVTQDQFVLEPMGECIAPFLSFVYNRPFFFKIYF